MPTPLRTRQIWFYPMMLLGGAAFAWFATLVLVDLHLSAQSGSLSHAAGILWSVISGQEAESVGQTLGNLPEVVVAILGIAITVVSIIVQLSATRYSPRVTEMFFHDRTNLVVLSFFVITSLHCIWATLSIGPSFIPRVLIVSTVAMITIAILILIPYFIYVFAFLDPERLVARLQSQALADALSTFDRGGPAEHRQTHVLEGIEQLADVAVNAIAQKDRTIASCSVDALKKLVVQYMENKGALPLQWFAIGPYLKRDPDFTVMAPASVAQLEQHRSWLEWKVLRQYQTIYSESLNRMRDVNELVSINTRLVGEVALRLDDPHLLRLSVKFFNTYLRATINSSDVRSAYNALNQYRRLTEAVVRHQGGNLPLALELAGYLRYYGQLANAAGLAFVTETAAHDLCQLCEVAHTSRLPQEQRLLRIVLDVDKPPETEAEERSLRGVRKAQLKLATFYLAAGAEDLARMIWQDMEVEPSERLLSIRQELLDIQDSDFWEVVDRGYNFDYLPPDRRPHLEVFFSWFGERLLAK